MTPRPDPTTIKTVTRGLDGVRPDELKRLSLDLAQIAFDIAGLVDPTPISDGAGTILSLVRGDWWGAGLSAVSMVPYIGDLAKAGKFPRYLKSVENAVAVARRSTEAANILAPVMVRVKQALDLLPARGGQNLMALRKSVDDFLALRKLKVARSVLPDISKQFSFRRFQANGYEYHEAAGRLGIPGKVRQHRSPSAQSNLSSGLGDDAGHLIGNRFGAPGGAENLGLQNWRANRYGSFKQLENHWAARLKEGTGIEVKVQDMYKVGEARPIARKVEWTEIGPNGNVTHEKLTFMNSHTARSRDMQDIPPTVTSPQTDNVYDLFTGKKINSGPRR